MGWLIKGLAWLLLGVLALTAIWWIWNTELGLLETCLLIVWVLVWAGFFLYKSFKAFAEVWRRRISRRVKIEVAVEKDTYLPGDVVNLSVRIMGKEQLDIKDGRVALVCANRYVYSYTSTGSDGDQTHHSKVVTEEVAAASERVMEEGAIRSGSYSEHKLAFEVPPTAPPSASGEITNVEWKIRVTLGVRKAPDVIEERLVTVLSPSWFYANWAESAPELDSAGVCEMGFRLPGRSFRVGGRIEGTLIVSPRQDFEARTVRVELVRREIVPREAGNTAETVQASAVIDESPRFQAGSSREYAFAMEVPEAAGPCLKTEQTYVGWWLRAVVDRGMAIDYELKQLLNVYNGPTATADRCPECGAGIPQGASVCAECGEAVSREGASVWARRDQPSETFAAPATPQLQEVFTPPEAPLYGSGRAQRKLVLLFLVAVALIFILVAALVFIVPLLAFNSAIYLAFFAP